jgi:hypothetical protein
MEAISWVIATEGGDPGAMGNLGERNMTTQEGLPADSTPPFADQAAISRAVAP